MRPLQFGPDPELLRIYEEMRLDELRRIIRETYERMRTPLWFWDV